MGITEVIWIVGAMVAIGALARMANLRRRQLIDELRDYVKRQLGPNATPSEPNEKRE